MQQLFPLICVEAVQHGFQVFCRSIIDSSFLSFFLLRRDSSVSCPDDSHSGGHRRMLSGKGHSMRCVNGP